MKKKEKNIYQPTDIELEVLHVLWESQPCTVRAVYDIISEKKKLSYTTIQTVMDRMFDYKMVARYKEGKAFYYKALLQESEVQKSLSQRLLDKAYKGSAMKMIQHALGQGTVSTNELEEIQQWLEAKKKEQNDDD
ncbi:MAG: BlaI/MecI/CopY family transcriptional regulator [Bacteroidota bacterium]